jgi:ABC-type Na+ efflux pump permease subunit
MGHKKLEDYAESRSVAMMMVVVMVMMMMMVMVMIASMAGSASPLGDGG